MQPSTNSRSGAVVGPRRSRPQLREHTGHDVAKLWHFVTRSGLKREFQRLHMRSGIVPLMLLAGDLLLVVMSIAVVVRYGWPLVPFSLLLIGSRQRAIIVLTHEAAHGALTPNKFVNNFVARYLLCPLMFIEFDTFCRDHTDHHKYLGDPERDTDFLHSEDDVRLHWSAVYLKQLLSLENWLSGGLCGMLRTLTWSQRSYIAAFWVLIYGIVAATSGFSTGNLFIFMWVTARMTVHYAIISFVIISDHVGLWPGASILRFARNHPTSGLLRLLIHPHNNGYHLTHHLLPGLPCYSLAKADRLLRRWHEYAQAEHCSSYFFGARSAVGSWCRLTERQAVYAR